MNATIIAQITIIVSAVIVIGLLFTHFYAGHKIKGLISAAAGLTSSSGGYIISIMLSPTPLLIYFSNILFFFGTILFYLSTQRLVERKPNYLEILIVAPLYAITLAIFQFGVVVLSIRQIVVSVAIIYIATRQFLLLYSHLKRHPGKYLYSYLSLSIIVISLQTVRLILIFTGINNLLVPNMTITANKLILIINALVFVVVSLITVITTSIMTRNELMRERQLLVEWSSTDYLTKTPNRRKLYQHLETLIKQNEPFAIVITDLDGFKAINDQYGHPVGDAVLMEYAKIIEHKKGKDTFIARFGGDEFVSVFPYRGDDDYLRSQVVTTVNLDNIAINNKKFSFALRSSGGVALYPHDGNTINELLKNADHALYTMKTNNRNNVGFYQDVKK